MSYLAMHRKKALEHTSRDTRDDTESNDIEDRELMRAKISELENKIKHFEAAMLVRKSKVTALQRQTSSFAARIVYKQKRCVYIRSRFSNTDHKFNTESQLCALPDISAHKTIEPEKDSQTLLNINTKIEAETYADESKGQKKKKKRKKSRNKRKKLVQESWKF